LKVPADVVHPICSAGIVLRLDSLACFIKEALAPESNKTLTRRGLEFDSNFKYGNKIGTRIEVDRIGLERLQIEGCICSYWRGFYSAEKSVVIILNFDVKDVEVI
jgi:hypothetical protein